MRQLKTLLTLSILPVLFGSCTVVKQTVAIHQSKKEAKQSLETAVPVNYVNGTEICEDEFAVNVTPKKAQPLSNKPSLDNNPLAIAGHSLNSFENIRTAASTSLYSFIDEWYGTPYRLGGTTKRGIDCSAFVRELYGKVYQTSLLRTAYEQFISSIRLFSTSQLKEGDLVFFKIHGSRISHVGVYLSNGDFVHSSCSKGVTISNLSDTYWSRYYAGGGRMLS